MEECRFSKQVLGRKILNHIHCEAAVVGDLGLGAMFVLVKMREPESANTIYEAEHRSFRARISLRKP